MTLTLTPAPSAVAAASFDRCCKLIGIDLPLPSFEPAVAVDGSASARRDGRWLAGCSVPRRAAELMIRKEAWHARSLGLVAPTHAQQISAVLDKIGPANALIVLAPLDPVADLLAVLDFEAELAAGRLHVAWDADSLRRLFVRHPGLSVPRQLARLPDADVTVAAGIIAWAQPTLVTIAAEHSTRLAAAAAAEPRVGRRVLVGRRFALWDDAGDALARVLGDDVLDTDQPAQSAECAAAEWANGADAVIAADRARPAWLASGRAWVNWVTRPTVPAFDGRHGRDALVLADAAWRPLAITAGWPANRVAVAGWPAAAMPRTDAIRPGSVPAFMLDLPDLATPADFDGITARRLVWEAVREELTRDPFAVGADALSYVRRAPARLGLPDDSDFPAGRFVGGIVGPACALGLARWLARQAVPFTLHGRGWAGETELADRWHGPVDSRASLHATLEASAGLIDPTLPHTTPAIAAARVPTVRPFGLPASRVLADVAALAAGRVRVADAGTVLSAGVIDALVRAVDSQP